MARPFEELDPIVIRKAAQLYFAGHSQKDTAESLGLSADQVRYLSKKPLFREELDKLAGQAGDAAVKLYSQELVPLMRKALKVISEKLDEGSLEASKMVLQTAGLLDKNRPQGQDSSINIILPGLAGQAAPVDIGRSGMETRVFVGASSFDSDSNSGGLRGLASEASTGGQSRDVFALSGLGQNSGRGNEQAPESDASNQLSFNFHTQPSSGEEPDDRST